VVGRALCPFAAASKLPTMLSKLRDAVPRAPEADGLGVRFACWAGVVEISAYFMQVAVAGAAGRNPTVARSAFYAGTAGKE
jgi:hypothetical protein